MIAVFYLSVFKIKLGKKSLNFPIENLINQNIFLPECDESLLVSDTPKCSQVINVIIFKYMIYTVYILIANIHMEYK